MEKEKLEIGDIIVITQRYGGAYGSEGNIAQIMYIDESNVPYQIKDFKQLYKWEKGYTWCRDVRKATHSELASIGITSDIIYEIF